MLRQGAVLDVQNELKTIIDKEARNYELMNLEIFHCHPEGSFKSANIRMPLFGIEEPVPTDPPTPWNIFMFEFEDVFNFKLLELLMKVGNPDDKNVHPDLMTAYNLLIDYVADKEGHDVCLTKVCKSADGSLPASSSETDIAYALAVHLFGPLTGGSCVLDNHSRSWPKSCPGGCKGIVQKGPTGIGATQIWHGFADILVSQKIPLTVWKEVPDIVKEEHDEDSDENSESVAEDSSFSSGSGYSSSVEILAMKQPLCQLIAQTITNSFAQVNQNRQLSHYLIPSFGCSNNQIVIFGYDSENDVLVKKVDPIVLWTAADNVWHLSVSAIVQIWMYIHFPVLMLPSLAERYDTNIQSNFHRCHTIGLFRKYSKCQTEGFPHEGDVNLLNTRYARPIKKLKTN